MLDEYREAILALEAMKRAARLGYHAVATDYGPSSPQEREAFAVLLGIEVRLDRVREEVATSDEDRWFVLRDVHSNVCGRVKAASHNEAVSRIYGRDVYFVKDVLANVTRQACVYTEAELANQ